MIINKDTAGLISDIKKLKDKERIKDIKIVDKIDKNAKIKFGEIIFDKTNNNLYIYLNRFYKINMEEI